MDHLSRHEHFDDWRRAQACLDNGIQRHFDPVKVATTELVHRIRTDPEYKMFEDFEVEHSTVLNNYYGSRRQLDLTMLVKKSLFRHSAEINMNFFSSMVPDIDLFHVNMVTRGHNSFPWRSKFKVALPESLCLAPVWRNGLWHTPRLPEPQRRALKNQGIKRVRIGYAHPTWMFYTDSEDDYLFARMLF